MHEEVEKETIEIPSGVQAAGCVRPPGSKSITNRALLIAALADGTSRLANPLHSEDTEVMLTALRQTGVSVQSEADGAVIRICGTGGRLQRSEADIFVGNSGTTIRFLTAALAACATGRFRLYGVPRMHERPIGELVQALRLLGARIEYEGREGFPPLVVHGGGLRGGEVTLSGSTSSQFVSGLLMAAPLASGTVVVHLEGPVVSAPFVEMTLRLMQLFDARVDAEWNIHVGKAASVERGTRVATFRVTPGGYKARELAIEPDATAASYFWGAAALTGGQVTVRGLTRSSLQGDIAFVDLLARMGARVHIEPDAITAEGHQLKGIEADMSAISDTAPTLAVLAAFASGQTRLWGLAHTRHQETDRVHAIATELTRIGAHVEERPDALVITPGSPRPAVIETYNDHRIAMAFALAGLRIPGLRIRNPACTAKTYPGYWNDLFALLKPVSSPMTGRRPCSADKSSCDQ